MSDPNLVTELRDSAAPFVRDLVDLKGARALRRTIPGYATSLLPAIAAMGWLGILIPESDGGLGLGFTEMAAVLEELEKGLMGEPLLGLLPGILALVHSEEGALRKRLLGSVVVGECLPALALDRDAKLPSLTAEPEGTDYRLCGPCSSVASASVATGFVVPARVGGDWGLFFVERGAKNLTIDYEWRADDTPLGRVELDGVVVAQHALVTRPGEAARIVERVLDESRVLVSASCNGLMARVLDMTLEYMRTRVQYDRPIGSFQALQHKAVDLHIQKELAISALGVGLAALDGGKDSCEQRLSAIRAKGRSSDACLRIAREAVQLHGAIGFTDEFDLGLYLKRALVLSAWLGNAAEQRRRFIRETLAERSEIAPG